MSISVSDFSCYVRLCAAGQMQQIIGYEIYAAAFADKRVIKNGVRFKAELMVEIELNLRWK